MAQVERIGFQEAVGETLLFKAGWDTLSVPQQAILKILYGQPLNDEELQVWHASQGHGVYDDIGRLVDLSGSTPYMPQEYHHATLVIGRRGSKTRSIASFIMAYEALLGGHERFVGESQSPIFLQVAQDIATAQANLRQFILWWLDKSPVGQRSIDVVEDTQGRGRKQQAITATTIRLKNRSLIQVGAPTIKLRSQAVAVCNMDELAVWPKDSEAANPDYEVERAVLPAMAQFPDWKLIEASTPWTEEGILWRAHEIGTRGCRLADDDPTRVGWRDFIYVNLPTAAMQNPLVRNSFLEGELAKDVEAFQREFLARFSKSVTGFLSSSLLREAVDRAVVERAVEPSHLYVAALDPAFRRDAFTFTIVHHEGPVVYRLCSDRCLAEWDSQPIKYATGKAARTCPVCGGPGADRFAKQHQRGIVQDVVRHWVPQKSQPLNPATIMDEIALLCKAYRVQNVTSDQYQLESLQQLAVARGFALDVLDWTVKTKARIYVNLQQLLNQKQLRLLDNPAQLNELRSLERELTGRGTVSIHAPATRHDDLASCLALACYKSAWFVPAKADVEDEPLAPDAHKRIFDAMMRKKQRERQDQVWWT